MKVQISTSLLSRLENGKRGLTTDKRHRIAQNLAVSVDLFFEKETKCSDRIVVRITEADAEKWRIRIKQIENELEELRRKLEFFERNATEDSIL